MQTNLHALQIYTRIYLYQSRDRINLNIMFQTKKLVY